MAFEERIDEIEAFNDRVELAPLGDASVPSSP